MLPGVPTGGEDPGSPAWVRTVRDGIARSPAWEVLSDQIYSKVSRVVDAHGLGHFSDLSASEQITLVEETHRELMIEDNEVFQAFESQFSKSMDEEIAKEARSRVPQDESSGGAGADEALYLDCVLQTAAEGAVSLLRELPREHLGSLRLMLNQPIPLRARLDVWALLLQHTNARQDYEQLVKKNRNTTISPHDIYITHRCQALLESGRIASSGILPLTSSNVVLMKTVLSYHHACKTFKPGQKVTGDVSESLVHFIVPLCAVITRGASLSVRRTAGVGTYSAGGLKQEDAIERMIEDLVQMFEGALEAGLQQFVDPKQQGENAAGTVGIAGVGRTRGRKFVSAPSSKYSAAPPIGAGTAEAIEAIDSESEPPPWVKVVHDTLMPSFRPLVDHLTLVHLGRTVNAAPNTSGNSSEEGQAGEESEAREAMSKEVPGTDNAETTKGASSIEKGKRQEDLAEGKAPGGSKDDPAHVESVPVAPNADGNGGKAAEAGAPASDPEHSVDDALSALWSLLGSPMALGLVGYLGADACLFAWDQAVIGGFELMMPRVVAMMVAALMEHLGACSTKGVMREVLASHAPFVPRSQLQHLMELHCMPSIRENLRVSEKLAPDIVGPSLATSTQILHSVYAKRTRVAQEARGTHIEHVLGPCRASARDQQQESLRLNLSHAAGALSSSEVSDTRANGGVRRRSGRVEREHPQGERTQAYGRERGKGAAEEDGATMDAVDAVKHDGAASKKPVRGGKSREPPPRRSATKPRGRTRRESSIVSTEDAGASVDVRTRERHKDVRKTGHSMAASSLSRTRTGLVDGTDEREADYSASEGRQRESSESDDESAAGERALRSAGARPSVPSAAAAGRGARPLRGGVGIPSRNTSGTSGSEASDYGRSERSGRDHSSRRSETDSQRASSAACETQDVGRRSSTNSSGSGNNDRRRDERNSVVASAGSDHSRKRSGSRADGLVPGAQQQGMKRDTGSKGPKKIRGRGGHRGKKRESEAPAEDKEVGNDGLGGAEGSATSGKSKSTSPLRRWLGFGSRKTAAERK